MKLTTSALRLLTAAALLSASLAAHADTRVIQVWSCTLKDGKTLEDLHAIHGKWVAWANEQSYGGNINARVATPIVSEHIGMVLIIDSYPSLEAWAADTTAFFGSEEGQAMEAEYDAVAACTTNTLYSETDSG